MLNPRNLILVDIAGAFMTSLITLVLFASDNLRTGMPMWVLICLGVTAAMLGLFGTYRLLSSTNHMTTLGILAFLNFDFCILAGALWWKNLERLTPLGWVYFPAELLVIAVLAVVELQCSFSKD